MKKKIISLIGLVTCIILIVVYILIKPSCSNESKDLSRPSKSYSQVATELHSTLDQRIALFSYSKNVWLIETSVWVRNRIGFAVTLEYHNFVTCNKEEVEKISKEEKDKAIVFKEKLDKILEGKTHVENK